MRWYASISRKEESSDDVWKSRLTELYLWCCQAVCSRPSDPQQRRPDGRTACDGGVERRACCCQPNVDAAYWQYRRPVCRDPPSMAEPCTGCMQLGQRLYLSLNIIIDVNFTADSSLWPQRALPGRYCGLHHRMSGPVHLRFALRSVQTSSETDAVQEQRYSWQRWLNHYSCTTTK